MAALPVSDAPPGFGVPVEAPMSIGDCADAICVAALGCGVSRALSADGTGPMGSVALGRIPAGSGGGFAASFGNPPLLAGDGKGGVCCPLLAAIIPPVSAEAVTGGGAEISVCGLAPKKCWYPAPSAIKAAIPPMIRTGVGSDFFLRGSTSGS